MIRWGCRHPSHAPQCIGGAIRVCHQPACRRRFERAGQPLLVGGKVLVPYLDEEGKLQYAEVDEEEEEEQKKEEEERIRRRQREEEEEYLVDLLDQQDYPEQWAEYEKKEFYYPKARSLYAKHRGVAKPPIPPRSMRAPAPREEPERYPPTGFHKEYERTLLNNVLNVTDEAIIREVFTDLTQEGYLSFYASITDCDLIINNFESGAYRACIGINWASWRDLYHRAMRFACGISAQLRLNEASMFGVRAVAVPRVTKDHHIIWERVSTGAEPTDLDPRWTKNEQIRALAYYTDMFPSKTYVKRATLAQLNLVLSNFAVTQCEPDDEDAAAILKLVCKRSEMLRFDIAQRAEFSAVVVPVHLGGCKFRWGLLQDLLVRPPEANEEKRKENRELPKQPAPERSPTQIQPQEDDGNVLPPTQVRPDEEVVDEMKESEEVPYDDDDEDEIDSGSYSSV